MGVFFLASGYRTSPFQRSLLGVPGRTSSHTVKDSVDAKPGTALKQSGPKPPVASDEDDPTGVSTATEASDEDDALTPARVRGLGWRAPPPSIQAGALIRSSFGNCGADGAAPSDPRG